MADNRARTAAGHRRQLEAAVVQDVERYLVPLSDLAEDVFSGHARILQDERRGRGAVKPHLVLLFAGADAGKRSFHQKCGERVFAVADDPGKDNVEVGEAAVGDPHLFAANREASIGLARGPRFRAERIRTGSGLAQGVRTDDLATDQTRQILLLLRLRAETDKRRDGKSGLRAERRRKGCGSTDRFTDKDRCDLVQADAAELLRDVGSEQAEFAGSADEAACELPILLLEPVERWLHLIRHELVGRLTDEPMLVGQLLRCEHRVSLCVVDQPGAPAHRCQCCHDAPTCFRKFRRRPSRRRRTSTPARNAPSAAAFRTESSRSALRRCSPADDRARWRRH